MTKALGSFLVDGHRFGYSALDPLVGGLMKAGKWQLNSLLALRAQDLRFVVLDHRSTCSRRSLQVAAVLLKASLMEASIHFNTRLRRGLWQELRLSLKVLSELILRNHCRINVHRSQLVVVVVAIEL